MDCFRNIKYIKGSIEKVMIFSEPMVALCYKKQQVKHILLSLKLWAKNCFKSFHPFLYKMP